MKKFKARICAILTACIVCALMSGYAVTGITGASPARAFSFRPYERVTIYIDGILSNTVGYVSGSRAYMSIDSFCEALGVEHAHKQAEEGEALRAELSKRSLFRGRFGTSPFKLYRCLKRRGLAVRCAVRRKKAAFSFGGVRAGVVLYRHRHGVHYVAFVPADDGLLHFYNDIPGKADHIERMETFLMRESTLPVAWLLTVR